MKAGAPFLFHSLMAPALNLGLLSPREVCRAAEAAWRAGTAPLSAVEGFVRQILGWHEYVRGVYWISMPGYASENALEATRKLPAFYWTGRTDMRCLREAIAGTELYAYSHHIQRLMVTGNFALAGVAPRGRDAQHSGHGGVRRRRADGFQALCGLRRLHRPHVGLLLGLRL